MNPILSAILIVILTILFFSFLTIRIDNTVKWNWFIIFIPIFFLKFCFLIDVIVLIIRNAIRSKRVQIIKLIIFLISILLFYIFEILLCLKLEYYNHLKLTFVFIPLWLLLSIASVYLFRHLIK